ncbi:DUF6798 domain-containing protein [Microbacterium sp. RU33B]|uniref:DUF6798 domain-containing protein n=1 Tax=Microbacterium sp. RU33B TaxID=1907390 RepID=UPI000962A0B4|nr:DUF6798 domain-containing protein [Microbacterium sp. RU33B]SIT88805.1 hypothetical protein SAMN05880545_3073 [Microbacterium sp. RU33B]
MLTGNAVTARTDEGVSVARGGSLRRLLPLTGVLTALLAVLQIWGTIGFGYFAGWGDHFVLSVEGLSWAHPGAFRNDWFMEVAPQPHWFFDVLTFAGESLGILSLVYVVFWGLGLVAFSLATALIAYRFFPSIVWPVAVGVTIVTAITPWAIGGTGSGMIAQALPAVLSANLIYLLIAGLLTGRRILVIVLAPLIAIVHVQQGSIALVLLASMLVVEGVRERRVDWYLGAALVLTAAFVAFGLTLRPVASNLEDFVRICDQVIPFHCAAHLWTRVELLSTIGLIVLAVLSAVVLPRSHRWIWYATVGLATLGYTLGFASDALRIPFLGTIAQGVNVYRLGAVLVPFAVWGLFAPLLVRLRGWKVPVFLVAWGVGWIAYLTAPGFPTDLGPRLVLMGLALLGPVVWFTLSTLRSADIARRSASASLVAGLVVLIVTAVSGGLTLREPSFTFIGDPNLRTWGEEVREVVPEGAVLVAPPRFEWVKLITQRAVIADCKDVPYGGEAWEEWQRRLDVLGGYKQCVAPGPLLYDKLSADRLIEVADEFRSDFIVVNPGSPETVFALEDRGWTRAVTPVASAGAELLQRPPR